MTLTKEQIKQYPDGIWIETDVTMSMILRTWPMQQQRPSGVFIWRRKQLLDQLGYYE